LYAPKRALPKKEAAQGGAQAAFKHFYVSTQNEGEIFPVLAI